MSDGVIEKNATSDPDIKPEAMINNTIDKKDRTKGPENMVITISSINKLGGSGSNIYTIR